MSDRCFSLVVKASPHRARWMVRRALPGEALRFVGDKPAAGGHRVVRVTVDEDEGDRLVGLLNRWFSQDSGTSAPYPEGSLLFWVEVDGGWSA